jgi:hypothetical protein
MIVRKSMPSLSDSNIYSAPKELPNQPPSTTTTWAGGLCPPSQRNSGSGATDTFVAVRQFSRADRRTRSSTAHCETS